MATTDDRRLIHQLEDARGHLEARGDLDAVKSLDAIIGRLVDTEPPIEPIRPVTPPTEDLVSAREAAKMLGVDSVAPVWTWVQQGRLTWRTVEGQHKITRASIEKLIDDPVVVEWRQWEAELNAALAPFDATEEDLAELYDWYPTNGKLDNGA
jgi:hypothetical protein